MRHRATIQRGVRRCMPGPGLWLDHCGPGPRLWLNLYRSRIQCTARNSLWCRPGMQADFLRIQARHAGQLLARPQAQYAGQLVWQNGRSKESSYAEWPLSPQKTGLSGHSAIEVHLMRPFCIRSAGSRGGRRTAAEDGGGIGRETAAADEEATDEERPPRIRDGRRGRGPTDKR